MEASDAHPDAFQMLKPGEGCRMSISFGGESECQVPQLQCTNRSNLPPPSLRGLRVILFEDVDIVFEEDSGFMNALTQLAKTSKCPIIFSSNSNALILKHLPTFLSIDILLCKVLKTYIGEFILETLVHICMVRSSTHI